MWNFNGTQRPDFAQEPDTGQESVWDYPRPPALVECDSLIEVRVGEQVITSSSNSKRMLETASPAGDIQFDELKRVRGSSYCGNRSLCSVLDYGARACKSERRGLAAKCCFHSRGVSCSMLFAG